MKTKNNITLIAAFAAIVAFSSSSQAQPSNAKIEEKIEHRVEKMKKELGLTEAQTTQVKAILEENKPQLEADFQKMKAASKDQKTAIREQLQKDREATNSKVLAVLNPEQQAKAEKYFNHQKEKEEHRE